MSLKNRNLLLLPLIVLLIFLLTKISLFPEMCSTVTGKVVGEETGVITGRVTGEKSGHKIPGVVVELDNNKGVVNMNTKTDRDGRYSFDNLVPGTYYVNFIPEYPYCFKWDNHEVCVESGKRAILNKTLELGGTINGKVYKSDGKTPFEEVIITGHASDGSVKETRTRVDGSYFLGNLCPSNKYDINVAIGIRGRPYKALAGITVEKGKETRVQNIVFNLNEVTGIEGYITSSCDGGPLENATVWFYKMEDFLHNRTISVGEVKTDKNGYYYMKGLDIGDYSVKARPKIPSKKDEVSGKPFFKMSEISRYFTGGKTFVKKGCVTRLDMKLNIPSYSSTMKTQVDIRLKYGKNLDKRPYRIVFEGLEEGTPLYTKEEVIKDQLDYRFVGINPGRYWFGLSFLENTGGGEKEKIYYTSLWKQGDDMPWRQAVDKIYVPWNYRVTIDLVISGKKVALQEESKKSEKSAVKTRVEVGQILKKRKERTFYYKIEVTRELY